MKPCNGKSKFDSPAKANAFRQHLKKRGRLYDFETVYYCDECSAYHIGSLPEHVFVVLTIIKRYTRTNRCCPLIDDVVNACDLSLAKTREAIHVLKVYDWLRPEFENKLVLSTKHIIPKEQ